MDVHHRINHVYNDMISYESRIVELELYNQAPTPQAIGIKERTLYLEQRNKALEYQMVEVTDTLGRHLDFW